MVDAADRRRARKELWTWRFAAALASATRVTWVIETHSAGGLYDEIRCYLDDPKTASGPTSVSYNRNGRLHLLGLPDGEKVEALDVVPDHGRALSIKRAVQWTVENTRPSSAASNPRLVRSLRLMVSLLKESTQRAANET